jgi:limonene-1,2-epoxide hydrolase
LYWPLTTNIGDARGGHQIYHASAPAGPWSGPVCLTELDGMGPDLTWDDEGTCLVAYCSWSENSIPMKPVIGRAAIRDDFARFLPQFDVIQWELLHQVASGNLVMDERTDTFSIGERALTFRVLGVFEVTGGLITAWRDYFDSAELAELPSVLGQ